MKYTGLQEHRTADGRAFYTVRCSLPVEQGKGSKRVTVGTYYNAEEAARAYDLAVLALGVQGRQMNFQPDIYSSEEVEDVMQHLSRPKNVKSSKFIGVRAKKGRWDARIRRNDSRVHLGYYDTEQDAAVQFDLAQLVCYQLKAATCANKLNFDWSDVPVEQINSMTSNVRLRISQKLGRNILEQQLKQQKQEQQLQEQEQHQCSSGEGHQVKCQELQTEISAQQQQLQPQLQPEGGQRTLEDRRAYKLAKQQAKQQLQEARATLLQSQRAQPAAA